MIKKRGIKALEVAVFLAAIIFLIGLNNTYGDFIKDDYNLMNGSEIKFSNIGIEVGDYLIIDGQSHKLDNKRIIDILIRKESVSKEKIMYKFRNLGGKHEIQFAWLSKIPARYDGANDFSLDRNFTTDQPIIKFYTNNKYESYMSFEDVEKTFGGVKLNYDKETRTISAVSDKISIIQGQEIVMDPSAGIDTNYPSIAFVDPTPKDNNRTDRNFVPVKINVTEENLKKFTWNWNGKNYTFSLNHSPIMMDLNNLTQLSESNTLVKDVSGHGNDGAIFGALFAEGKIGGGLAFLWNDYLNIADKPDVYPEIFSVELWFNPKNDYDSNNGHLSLVYGKDYEIFMENGKIAFRYKENFIVSDKDSWNKDTWYHIIATYDGVQKLFINGRREASLMIDVPLRVKNDDGQDVAIFLKSGDIRLKGRCRAGLCMNTPGGSVPDGSFVIRNETAIIGYIDPAGNLCVKSCSDIYKKCNPVNELSIKDDHGKVVSSINSEGLCLKGILMQEVLE